MAGIPGRAPGSPGSTHIAPLDPLDPLGETREITPEELAEATKKRGGGTKITPNLIPVIGEMRRDGYSTTAISNRLADEYQVNIHPATLRTFFRKQKEARAAAYEEAISQAVVRDATSDLTRLAKLVTELEEAMEFHASRPRMWLKLVESYRRIIDTKLKYMVKGAPIPNTESEKVEKDFRGILEEKLAALPTDPAAPAPAPEDDEDPGDPEDDEDPGDPDE
jgi:hypothetical protein